MSDFESQQLDDELLSAYLDGELSPEERAAVEARLAVDPSAEQVLHQLRAVSQAVQGLPPEAVGYDLRDSILHRAVAQSSAKSKATTSTGLPHETENFANGDRVDSGESVPTLSIGRTWRGWMWASLAVAAAILIMVFQSKPDDQENRIALAKREPAADSQVEDHVSNDRALGLRALEEPPAPSAAPVISEDQSSVAAHRFSEGVTEGETIGGPSPSELAVAEKRGSGVQLESDVQPLAQSNQPLYAFGSDVLRYSDAASPQRGATAQGTEEPAGASAGENLGLMPPTSAEQLVEANGNLADTASLGNQPVAAGGEQIAPVRLVVVRVVAKRAALEGKAFDRLLERNGIDVESDAATASGESAPALSQQREGFSRSRSIELRDTAPLLAEPDGKDVEAETNALLVEASPAAIAACLESLHADEANYLAVAVEDAQADPAAWYDARVDYNYFSIAQDESGKELAEQLGWKKFGRGTVPEQDKEVLDKLDLSYDVKTRADQSWGGRGFGGGGYGMEELSDQPKEGDSFRKRIANESKRGWARRIWALPAEDANPTASAAQSQTMPRGEAVARDGGRQPDEVRLQLGTPANVNGETLPVLFVLMPAAEAAPSPADEDRAE